MKQLIALCLACACAAGPATALATAPVLPDTEVSDATGARVRLDGALAGKRTIVLVVDPAWAEARSWLIRVLGNSPASLLEETVVLVASPQANDKAVDLGLSRWPAVRVYTDKQGLLVKGGKVRTLPTVLGASANGTVRAQASGAMATQLDLGAFSRHLRVAASGPN